MANTLKIKRPFQSGIFVLSPIPVKTAGLLFVAFVEVPFAVVVDFF